MRGIALLLSMALAEPAAAAEPSRYAIIVGNNQGAVGRPKLWFAEKDAERFHRALHELGGFSRDRSILLTGRGAGELRRAFATLETLLAARRDEGERAFLLVYYSGHAGPGGLELGRDRISFEELRGLVTASSATTRLAIVDACEAGC